MPYLNFVADLAVGQAVPCCHDLLGALSKMASVSIWGCCLYIYVLAYGLAL